MTRDELTLATFNIWFSDYHAEQRYRAIADLLARNMPDVMVFQEVTPAALAVLLAQPWVRVRYRRAEVTGGDRGNYGMLMLSRLPIGNVTYTRLPTKLARGFLTAELNAGGSTLTVVAAHLESGKAAARLRARQLGRIFRSLRRAENAVVLGDFNIRDAENGIITAPYRDLWPVLRPHDDGFTEDTSINLMRYDSKNKHRHVRFDRVLLKGDGWAPTHIELLGTEPISDAPAAGVSLRPLRRVLPPRARGAGVRRIRPPPTILASLTVQKLRRRYRCSRRIDTALTVPSCGAQRGVDPGAHVVDVEVGADRDQAVGAGVLPGGGDVNRRPDHVDDVAAHPLAGADGDGALEPIDARGRLLEEVEQHTGVDAAVAGRRDGGGVHVVVVIGVRVDEQFADRQLTRGVVGVGHVVQQGRVDPRADRADHVGMRIAFADPRFDAGQLGGAAVLGDLVELVDDDQRRRPVPRERERRRGRRRRSA